MLVILGISLMWWALLCAFTAIGALFCALMHLADRLDASRRDLPVIGRDVGALPVAVARPTRRTT